MQLTPTIFPFYIRVSLRLALLCTSVICAFALIGHGTPRRVIAFVTITDYNPKLHLMDVQSRIVHKISDIPVFLCCLVWSPDGSAIAFNGNNEQNYVVDIDDGETRRLTAPNWSGWVMGWSAEGRRVILGTLSATNGSLYRVDADGENFGLLADGASNSIFLPLLSPDGRFAYYAIRLLNSNDFKIFRLNLEDGTDQLLINESYNGSQLLSISRDGQHVAYALTQRREILLINADGSNVRPVPTTEDILEMVWSPDGQQILFLGQDAAGVQNVYVTDGDGQNPRDLGIQGAGVTLSDFSWSPDSTQIVFVASKQLTEALDLYVIDADGKNLQRLTFNAEHDLYPAWQPGT